MTTKSDVLPESLQCYVGHHVNLYGVVEFILQTIF